MDSTMGALSGCGSGPPAEAVGTEPGEDREYPRLTGSPASGVAAPVAVAEPPQVLGWETSTGESAKILRTERLSYWQLNQPGDEPYRKSLRLGLQ